MIAKLRELKRRLLALLKRLKDRPNKIIVHHSASDADFDNVNNYHRRKWNFRSELGYYIGYTYWIDREGKITQGRLDTEEGAHTYNYNNNSIGICLQGNGQIKDFTKEQYNSLKDLIEEKKRQYLIKKVGGHRDYAATLCPSDRLYKFLKEL